MNIFAGGALGGRRGRCRGRHLLVVMRYGDLNPVRAGLVRCAKDWQWSSYRHYALGEIDPLIDDAPDYLALGRTSAERRKAYQALFARSLYETLYQRCSDLVDEPFIGDDRWVVLRLVASGLSPPEGAHA